MGRKSREHLEQEVIRLGGIEATYNSLRHLLPLAMMARDSIMTDLESHPELTPSEIGDRAFEVMKLAVVEDVRDQLCQDHEEKFRGDLYQRAVEEIQAKEGDDLYRQVEEQIEADPDLQVKLRKSARAEVMKRTAVRIEEVISAEEEVILEEEAQRQIDLDRFDVRFAVDGQLDLKEAKAKDTLKPGDSLTVNTQTPKGHNIKVVLRWTKDVNDREGWILAEGSGLTDDQRATISSRQFVEVGSEMFDLEGGTGVDTPNLLKKDRKLVLFTKTKKGKNKGELKPIDVFYPIRNTGYSSYNYGYTLNSLTISSVDFRTREHALNRRSR